MSAIDDFKAIWRNYQTIRDCIKIASRSISQNDLSLLKKTDFFENTADEADEKIQVSQKDADDYVIMTLWACFERNLFSRFTNDIVNPDSKLKNKKIGDHIERLQMVEVIDAFKKSKGEASIGIDSKLIGIAKQIYHYRNWIAHRNPKKPSPANVTPNMAYKTLLEILQELDSQNILPSQ